MTSMEIAARMRFRDTAINAQNSLIYMMRQNGVIKPEDSVVIKGLSELVSEEYRKILVLEDKLEAASVPFNSFDEETLFIQQIQNLERRIEENNDRYLTASVQEKCMLREERYKLEDQHAALELEFRAKMK